jgi:hypothetical protein
VRQPNGWVRQIKLNNMLHGAECDDTVHIQRGFYRRGLMTSGSWDHSLHMELFGILSSEVHSISISPNSGVCLFQHHCRNYNDFLLSELAGKSKWVAWKSISEENAWCINKAFSLPKQPLENPTWFSESNLRVYWKLWYSESESGNEFAFKRVHTPGKDGELDSGARMERGKAKGEGSEEEDGEDDVKKDARGKGKGKGREDKEEDTEVKDKSRGTEEEKDEEEVVGKPGRKSEGEEGDEEHSSISMAPDQCRMDEEKLTFLQSLLPKKQEYQAIVEILA